MKFIYNDGGRDNYFKASNVGDCVTRAICNATGKDYKEVYDRLKEMSKCESVKRHRGHKRSSVRDGVFKETWKRYLKEIGWVHHSTCELGSHKDKVKFVEGALPDGILIVQLSKHLTCLKDQVIYDTYDCSRKEYYDEFGNLQVNDQRTVYGYWTAPTKEQLKEREETKAAFEKAKQIQQESLKQTKEKIQGIKDKYKPSLSKLEKKIKELTHQLTIETNRMNREIKKVKEEGGNKCIDLLLSN